MLGKRGLRVGRSEIRSMLEVLLLRGICLLFCIGLRLYSIISICRLVSIDGIKTYDDPRAFCQMSPGSRRTWIEVSDLVQMVITSNS